jgi:hypothetical protein
MNDQPDRRGPTRRGLVFVEIYGAVVATIAYLLAGRHERGDRLASWHRGTVAPPDLRVGAFIVNSPAWPTS